jgi:hypothetical protein
MPQQSSRMCLLDRELLHVQSHITSILQLEIQQHWCVLLPMQLLLSATRLNNSNKQTSPVILCVTAATAPTYAFHPVTLALYCKAAVQHCLLPVAPPSLHHMLLCSLSVAVLTHSDANPRYVDSLGILVFYRAPIMA